jgi:hypothetical protein
MREGHPGPGPMQRGRALVPDVQGAGTDRVSVHQTVSRLAVEPVISPDQSGEVVGRRVGTEYGRPALVSLPLKGRTE